MCCTYVSTCDQQARSFVDTAKCVFYIVQHVRPVGIGNSILDVINGLVITGGAFDVDPKYYAEKIKYKNLNTKKSRTIFEVNICKQALKRNIPILGICGGQQLINIIYGGSLYQDIKKDFFTII